MDYAANPAALDKADLETLQHELKDAGFYRGTIDGDCGPATKAAWRTAVVVHLIGPILTSTDLTAALRAEYQRAWNAATVEQEHRATVEAAAKRLLVGRVSYEAVASNTGVPWPVIGVIHMREADFDFHAHLHNGDSLDARTVHVPAGRPRTGNPPFPWAYSATDALVLDGLAAWRDWSVPGMLWMLERFNGFGYRHRGRTSPYLFNFTVAGMPGKFVADGVFDPQAQDAESGCAAVLKVLVEQGAVSLGA